MSFDPLIICLGSMLPLSVVDHGCQSQVKPLGSMLPLSVVDHGCQSQVKPLGTCSMFPLSVVDHGCQSQVKPLGTCSMLPLSVVDHGFKPKSGQTNDLYQNCYSLLNFLAKHTTLSNNVSEWTNMLFQ
jgi:hypothetical protein